MEFQLGLRPMRGACVCSVLACSFNAVSIGPATSAQGVCNFMVLNGSAHEWLSCGQRRFAGANNLRKGDIVQTMKTGFRFG